MLMIKKVYFSIILAVGGGASGVACASDPSVPRGLPVRAELYDAGPTSIPETSPETRAEQPSPSKTSRATAGNFAVLREVFFFASPSLSRFWNIAHDRKSVLFTSYELLPGGKFGKIEQEVSTSFSIQDIAPRGGNEVFVGGHSGREGFLIERWTFRDVVGTTTGMITASGTPVGVPVSPATLQVYVPGGVQTPLAERSPPPAVIRKVVVEDANVGYKGIGADPEGRFLLVVTRDAELRQYFLDGDPGDYVLLANVWSLPDLAHVEGLFIRVQHAVFGRLWFLEWHAARDVNGTYLDLSTYQTVVLVDANNDGVFEQITPHPLLDPSLEPYSPSLEPYKDRSLWINEFLDAP